MTYGIGIGFPLELTEKDMKKLKRDLAYDKFSVIDGGKEKQKQVADKHENETNDDERLRRKPRCFSYALERG